MTPLFNIHDGLSIHFYGLFVGLAATLASLWTLRRCERRGLPADVLVPAFMAATLAGIAGAKTLHALLHWREYRSLADAAAYGYSSVGGFAAAISVAWLCLRRLPADSLLDAADASAAPLSFGYALAKVGCFLAGCCYGEPFPAPLGMAFDPSSPAGAAFGRTPLFPLQLLASAAFAALGLAWLRWERRFRRPGAGFAAFLAAFLVLRLLLDGWRADEAPVWLGLNPARWVSLAALTLLVPAWMKGGRTA